MRRENCKLCGRKITRAILARRRAAKVRNAHASRRKAKANGNKMGRRKQRDDFKIKYLRRCGLTIREIAQSVGFSTTAVQRGLRE